MNKEKNALANFDKLSFGELTAITNFEGIETKALYETMGKAITFSADSLYLAAKIYEELNRRGEDLSQLQSNLTKYFPMIAQNKLSASLAMRFAAEKRTLEQLSHLPIADQEKLVSGGVIKVVERDINGRFKVKEKNISNLSLADLKLAVGASGFRKIEDQKEYMTKRERDSAGYVFNSIVTLKIDADSGYVKIGGGYMVVGGNRVGVSQLLEILSGFYGTDLRLILRKNGLDPSGLKTDKE